MNPGLKYAEAARTQRWRSYGAQRAEFERWCELHRRAALGASNDAVLAFVGARDSQIDVIRRVRAISWMHREAGLADPTATDAVRALVDGSARAATRRPRPGIEVDDVIRVLGTLDPKQPTDARHGSMITLSLASGLHYRKLASAERSQTRITEHGIVIAARRGRHFVANGSSPGTCPAYWTARWLEHVGTQPGPLFVARGLRGGWSARPISTADAWGDLARVWRRAGLAHAVPDFYRLRREFALRAIREAPAIVVAHQLGVRSMADLDRGLHLPNVAFLNHFGRQKRRAKGLR